MKEQKPKIAIIGLTSCEGCEFALLDLGHDFLDFIKQVDLAEFRLLEEEFNHNTYYDLCFIEGSPITKANVELLKTARQKSKYLIALGNCAAMGGIHEIKNYHDKKKVKEYIYGKDSKVANPDIKEIDNYVKVDFTIRGCPITGLEFLQIAYNLLRENRTKLIARPVCYECQKNGLTCLLQKGEPCLGPIIQGGCNAICLKSKMPCQGCRGLFAGAQVDTLIKKLNKDFGDQRINSVLEIFGLRDEVEGHLKSII
ncbi:MAG: hypothetical protein AUJ28_01815 [Parcubacteria group bacterium CG1_02_37_51]|uniref:NADH:ubiquinone oxidoreductase-like 20kDa subunit domain-containing protein n=2 Tax=Candidatus Komeiliibacteriota TaxID=1817908 RepID=A0A2M8DR12_9BACT|nr:MAG: hypothetical protein AUJ28_01815 [Parcubacteria group bacterium CG1_02_37_51]PIY93942.1 MAG: hypothetical protein COY67_03395 [Candidatus Komeilibacteria bacterium CG_4_10_14_0_8_um_filter_37_78]PJC01787.1 MAG: hypothetical protein CO073_02875 [Candidatus Komeilibacteria bacterium CG_4_9_14_0_8_um_filter_36_9]